MTVLIWWFIEISKALLPFVIAGFAAWIALQQMRTAQRKLRLDLFDRRLAIFSFVNDFAYHLLAYTDSAKIDEMWAKLEHLHDEVGLLFGSPVEKLMIEFDDAANVAASARGGEPEERKQSRDAFNSLHAAVRAAMKPFLDFADIR